MIKIYIKNYLLSNITFLFLLIFAYLLWGKKLYGLSLSYQKGSFSSNKISVKKSYSLKFPFSRYIHVHTLSHMHAYNMCTDVYVCVCVCVFTDVTQYNRNYFLYWLFMADHQLNSPWLFFPVKWFRIRVNYFSHLF